MHLRESETLGVPLAANKAEGPTTVITFLGLEMEKLIKLKRKLENALKSTSISLQDIQSLAPGRVVAAIFERL